MPRSGDPAYGRSILQLTLHQEIQGQLARLRQLLLAIWGGLVLIGLLPSLLSGEQPIQAAPLSRLAAYTPGGDDSVDLEVIKTVNSSLVYEGDTITYTIAVTNKGPNLATDVYLIDTLPAEVTFDGSTATQGSYASPGGLWEVGSIAKGASAILTITAGVNNGTACTTITNTASILSADQSNQPNHTGQATTAVACSPRSADLAVSKTVNKIAPDEGEVITYTIRVTNLGPNEATNVQLTDTLPTQLTYLPPYLTSQGHYHSNGVWTIGELAQHASATLTLRVSVKSGAAGTIITNTTSGLTADQIDSSMINNTSGVAIKVNGANLTVTKSVNNAVPNAGNNIIYTVQVSNNGPNEATGVQLTEVLPKGLLYVAHTISQGSYNPSIGLWTVGNLANGATATLTLTVHVSLCPYGNPITNIVSMTHAAPIDPDTGNNEARIDIMVMNKDCDFYLPIILSNYIPLSNGDFETGNLSGWSGQQGPFQGHGSGLPHQVTIGNSGLGGSYIALLGNPTFQDGSIPVGYSSIAQTFTVDKPYLRIRYQVLTYDIVRGSNSGKYFDTFEVSLNSPSNQISDSERDSKGCATTALNPTGTLIPGAGLVFCGGYPGSEADVDTLRDLGWRTVILDLQNFQGTNITLYLALWNREHEADYWGDEGYYNTWIYLDEIKLSDNTSFTTFGLALNNHEFGQSLDVGKTNPFASTDKLIPPRK